MKTFGSLFTGFGGADLGAMMAGLTPIWGVELDPKIAGVGNQNLGGHIKIADVLGEDPRNYDQVDVFHASPPCTRASTANSSAEINEEGTKESPLDIALAEKVIEFIEALQPQTFTLENVIAYRHFQSWKGGSKTRGIRKALESNGYKVSIDHVNFADLGVPQTRKRMIVRAIKGERKPAKLALTHIDPRKIVANQLSMFDAPEPWIGWYEAIQDLIPTLTDSRFAPWQIKRLPAEIRSMLVSNSKTEWAEGENNKFTMPIRMEDEPIFTMRSTQNDPRAFVVDCQLAGDPTTDRVLTIRDEAEPMFTVTATQQKRIGRAFIINGDNATRELSIRDQHDPSFTVTDGKHPIKGYSSGRVVAMTPRCLARFQSFPDHYVLPENKTLACKGIGNAVPPLGYAKIVKPLLEYI